MRTWAAEFLRGRTKGIVAMPVMCDFRFEERPDSELVELEYDNRTARVCEDCLTILTVHRRIHRMKIEKVIVMMAER